MPQSLRSPRKDGRSQDDKRGHPHHLPFMTTYASNADVVIVGAGSAGIAAGRTARVRGLSVLLLEARDRVGGRAHTSDCGTPYALDLGCEWLHSADRNVCAGLARDLGLKIDKRDPPWRKRQPQRGFGFEDQDAFGQEQAGFTQRLDDAAAVAEITGRDRPAAELLDSAARFNGLTDAISTYYNGAPLERVSVLDFGRYTDTEEDWRVEGGYGAMFAQAASGLPVRLGCHVTAIDHSGSTIRVETSAGTIEAGHVVVTVPTNVLAAGAIRFSPALDDHLHAASHLPLGLADKLYMRLASPGAVAPETRLMGSVKTRDTGAYTLRPRGRDLVEGYFGGDYARELEKGGLPAFADAARREIAEAYGHDFAGALVPVVATGWAGDPLAMGSYSHALPGHADSRGVLAKPVDGRLFFAGEATSRHFFSTAHGAFEEGTRAALAIAAGQHTRWTAAG